MRLLITDFLIFSISTLMFISYLKPALHKPTTVSLGRHSHSCVTAAWPPRYLGQAFFQRTHSLALVFSISAGQSNFVWVLHLFLVAPNPKLSIGEIKGFHSALPLLIKIYFARSAPLPTMPKNTKSHMTTHAPQTLHNHFSMNFYYSFAHPGNFLPADFLPL